MTDHQTIEACAQVADDFATLADATFLAWQTKARDGTDGMDIAGGCAIGMAHQARRIAEAIRAKGSPELRAQAGEKS